MPLGRAFALSVVGICLFAGSLLADDIELLPAECVLTGREAGQQVLVQRASGGEYRQQVHEVEWSTSNPAVVAVTDGRLQPVGDGNAVITARAGGSMATSRVSVRGFDVASERSFRHDVLPLLAKQNCNSGACHGALAGKGGFRLSLRGYDPVTDYFNIVKQDRGRRIELADPGRSLLLAKPTGAIPHKGGVRFETDSLEYRILADWVAAGTPPPSADDPRLEQLEILPSRSVHAVGETQQLVVRARYGNGTVRDVTRWVKWNSSNETVCRIDDHGLATIIGPGEGAVVAWYASQLALASLTVPYNQVTAGSGATAPATPIVEQERDNRAPRGFIDERIDKQLARLQLPASPACGDADFIRRASIDTIGRLPTPEEVRTFLADRAADKRDKLIDALLARPEFVDYWTYKWSDVLTVNGTLLRPASVKSYHDWIRARVQSNTPWDQFVREILTATGDSQGNGATTFYALSQSPEEMSENACQAFLGLSLACAKCHNHPLEKWTNDQYYGMANLFARVKAKGWGGEPRSGDGLRTVYVAASGELVQPRTGKPQPPTPLDGQSLPFDDPADRRLQLAAWLTSPDNPYFARSISNRVWANFMGVGLVEAIDDLRASNPASNPELLAAAARYLVEQKFDLKALMKAILQSNAYQRSSSPLPGNKAEQRFYSRYYPRRLTAEVLHDALVQVTGVPTKFEWIAFPGADKQKTDIYPLGTHAIQLYDSAVENYFLQAFGRNQRRIVCECERSDQPSMVQVLHLSNGDTLNQKLKAPGNTIEQLLSLRREGMSDETLLDEVYLMCLARYPDAERRRTLAAQLPASGSADERAVLEDIVWAIVTSREFLFNH